MKFQSTFKTVVTLGIMSALSVILAVSASAQQKKSGHPKLGNSLNAISGAFRQGGASGAQAAAESHGLSSRGGGRVAVIAPFWEKRVDRQCGLGVDLNGSSGIAKKIAEPFFAISWFSRKRPVLTSGSYPSATRLLR